MERVAIALGSNLGDRATCLMHGVDALRALIPDLVFSRVVETDPVGLDAQPRFLNAAAAGHWRGGASELLGCLLSIEASEGRTRPYPLAPRTLDLDLVLFGEAVIRTAELTVPHPRFRERAFVLGPLSEVAADMRDPVTGRTVGELWHLLREVRGCA